MLALDADCVCYAATRDLRPAEAIDDRYRMTTRALRATAVASNAGGESGRTCQCFTGTNDRETALCFFE